MAGQHTPGPWDVYGGEIGTAPDATLAVVCALSGNDGDNEEDANARLIAAAPDLLAALEALARWETCDLDAEQAAALMDEVCDMARAAIAKAVTL